MKISLLNVKILLQKNSVTVDKIGNHKNKWQDFYSCYAYVSEESPSENTKSETVSDTSEIDFTVRHCRKVSEINSVNYRVVFGGKIYGIIGIDHMNFKNRSVKIKCRRERDDPCQTER